MKLHEFYQRFANTPIEDRKKPLPTHNPMSLYMFYREIKKTEERRLEELSRQEELLAEVEKFLTPQQLKTN